MFDKYNNQQGVDLERLKSPCMSCHNTVSYPFIVDVGTVES